MMLQFWQSLVRELIHNEFLPNAKDDSKPRAKHMRVVAHDWLCVPQHATEFH